MREINDQRVQEMRQENQNSHDASIASARGKLEAESAARETPNEQQQYTSQAGPE